MGGGAVVEGGTVVVVVVVVLGAVVAGAFVGAAAILAEGATLKISSSRRCRSRSTEHRRGLAPQHEGVRGQTGTARWRYHLSR